jgi:hypothetical protein
MCFWYTHCDLDNSWCLWQVSCKICFHFPLHNLFHCALCRWTKMTWVLSYIFFCPDCTWWPISDTCGFNLSYVWGAKIQRGTLWMISTFWTWNHWHGRLLKQGTLPQLLHHDHVVTLMFKDNSMIYMVCLLPNQLQHILKVTLVWPFFLHNTFAVCPSAIPFVTAGKLIWL